MNLNSLYGKETAEIMLKHNLTFKDFLLKYESDIDYNIEYRYLKAMKNNNINDLNILESIYHEVTNSPSVDSFVYGLLRELLVMKDTHVDVLKWFLNHNPHAIYNFEQNQNHCEKSFSKRCEEFGHLDYICLLTHKI